MQGKQIRFYNNLEKLHIEKFRFRYDNLGSYFSRNTTRIQLTTYSFVE